MNKLPIELFWSDETEEWICSFNLISTFGETPEEALEGMNEVIRDLFEDKPQIINEFREQFYMLSMRLFYDKIDNDQNYV